jgi:multicomponent Na+:H+ antiporter subunit C
VSYLPYAVAGWLFFAGLYGIVTTRNLIHAVMCLNVMQSSTYVLLLAIGYRTGGRAPIFRKPFGSNAAVDPIVQALTLTDVVVSVVISALILALVLDIHSRAGTVDPDELRQRASS